MPKGAATIGTTHTRVSTSKCGPAGGAADPVTVTNRQAVSVTQIACPAATLGPSKNIMYTDISVKKYQPNSANSQLPSSNTTAAIAISADTTKASENRRDGHGNRHQARPHPICNAANVAIAIPDAAVLAAGCNNTSETIPSRPVPIPIAT